MKIRLNDIKLFGYHGLNSNEKKDGQNFTISISLLTNINIESIDDNIDNTIDYTIIYKIVKKALIEKKLEYEGSRETLREYLHVDDAASATVNCINKSNTIFLWAPGKRKSKIIKKILADKYLNFPASYLRKKNNYLFNCY